MLTISGLPPVILVPQTVALASVSRQWGHAGTENTLCLADVLLFLRSREVSEMRISLIKLAFLTRTGF